MASDKFFPGPESRYYRRINFHFALGKYAGLFAARAFAMEPQSYGCGDS